ncbi:MAG: hypothetical protein ACXAB7_14325 [Candidatus Kariarchaeaceae archaeon]|jgi:hypothetical protein
MEQGKLDQIYFKLLYRIRDEAQKYLEQIPENEITDFFISLQEILNNLRSSPHCSDGMLIYWDDLKKHCMSSAQNIIGEFGLGNIGKLLDYERFRLWKIRGLDDIHGLCGELSDRINIIDHLIGLKIMERCWSAVHTVLIRKMKEFIQEGVVPDINIISYNKFMGSR